LRDAWGKRASWGWQECRDPEHGRENWQNCPGKVCWQAKGPLRSTQKAGFETPAVFLKHVLCVILDR